MFHERIKELRLSLGYNQVQFARKLFVTKQSVSNWENDNISPSIDMLMRISTTFSISTDYLLGLNDHCTLDVSGLSNEEILHIQNFVNDLRALKPDNNQ